MKNNYIYLIKALLKCGINDYQKEYLNKLINKNTITKTQKNFIYYLDEKYNPFDDEGIPVED